MYVVNLRFDNEVINEGEKLHFTLRLDPSPPNPSSFYASPEFMSSDYSNNKLKAI